MPTLPPRIRRVRLGRFSGALISSLAVFAHAARAHADSDDEDAAQAKPAVSEVVVTARRLDVARATVEPSLGASTYAVTNDTVESRPGGEAVKLGQVLQQFPGVVQIGSQALEVRGQQNLQYRINGIIVPGGFSDLADTLRARFADKIDLVTGALPAQYGLHVGGIVNVTTKNGVYEPGGEGELYGGSRGHLEAAYEAGGSVGKTNFYSSGSYLRDDVGLSSPDGSATPAHDATQQWDGFVLAEHLLDPASRLSLIAGVSDDSFQLPIARAPGPAAQAALQDQGGAERHLATYAIAAYQHSGEKLTVLGSAFVAYSRLAVTPDAGLDLALQGLARSVADDSASTGLQIDGVYQLASAHTLRAGLYASWSGETGNAHYLATVAGPSGPLASFARAQDRRVQASPYVEDEWRPSASLTVNFGVRFDDVTGQGGGAAFSPRANAVWKGPDGLTAHAGYARYFVPAPIDNEAGWPASLVGTSAVPPGPPGAAARPETDDYVDVGVQEKRDHLTLGVDAYWRRAANLIDEVAVGDTLLQRPFNFAQGRARGVELEATYDAGPFSAWANVAFARAEGRAIVTGQSMFTPAELAASARAFVPVSGDQRATASFGLSYHRRALLLSADAIFGSGLPRTVNVSAPDGGRLPAYGEANFSAVYRLAGVRGRPIYLRADLINAFDARYALTDGTALEGGAPQWGLRRTIIVGLEQSF